MDALARTNLEKLLISGERSAAGLRTLQASLTEAKLADYRRITSLQKKESFEQTMRAAWVEGAIEWKWDGRDGEGFIKRVNLLDIRKLSQFLGKPLTEDLVAEAREHLQPFIESYPVLEEVLNRWTRLRGCRGLGPESYQDWIDAIRTITGCAESEGEPTSLPVREFSARLFKDSKRVEKLIGPLDILLSGSTEGEVRQEPGVLQELGLYREEQPILIAGNVVIKRERITAVIDRPYAGFPAATLQEVGSRLSLVMTIENLTTFHSEARRRCDEDVLLIYTAGMPSPAWRAMYIRLLKGIPNDVPIFHWGDVDEGGFRIASTISHDALIAGHTLEPWKMSPNDVPQVLRCGASEHTLNRIRHFATAAGWSALGDAIADAGFTVEQEGLS
jgi:hypothetical protein